MVKKQAGDTSPEKLRLGPGAKTKAFGVAPEMTISKGDVEASRVNRKVKSPLKSPFRKKSNTINSISFNPAAKTGKLSFLKTFRSNTIPKAENDENRIPAVASAPGFQTDDTLTGPSSDEMIIRPNNEERHENDVAVDERLEEDIGTGFPNVPEEHYEDDTELDWIEQDALHFQKMLNKQCNNCATKAARWYCHGCNFSFCIDCHQNIHRHFVKEYFNEQHIIERIDGGSLECSFCRKTAFELETCGYTSYQKLYKKKYNAHLKEALRKGKNSVENKLSADWAVREKEKKRTLRDDVKEAELTKAIGEMDIRVRKEVLSQHKAFLEPLQYDALHLSAANSEHRNNAAFKYDFTRQSVICKSCTRYMNTNAKFKRKSIQIEAYAAPTPYLDPAGVAEKTLIKIRSDREARIAAAAMKKADKIAAEKKKKKSSVCNIL